METFSVLLSTNNRDFKTQPKIHPIQTHTNENYTNIKKSSSEDYALVSKVRESSGSLY